MPQPSSENVLITPTQNCFARALYDNIAESPDELAFRKGEVLEILEQNTGGFEGWWLCSLRGRQGICPGNRLRLIAGVFEDTGQSRESSPQLTEIPGDLNVLQKQGKRRSWHVQPNKVLTPKKYNDVYLYDMPPSRCSPVQGISPGLSPREAGECYDIPPRPTPVGSDNSRNCSSCSPAPPAISPTGRDLGDSYDVPRPLLLSQQLLTPSSSASSLTADSFSSSNRSSVVNMPDYDVPRPHNVNRGPQLHLHPSAAYDVPPNNTSLRELPLELGSALESLERLQAETTGAISKLLGFVTPHWRQRDKLESKLLDIKLVVVRLRTSLHDLAEFCEGALGNAAKASDKGLVTKLTPLVTALRNSDRLVQDAAQTLDGQSWSLDLLTRSDEEDKIMNKPDSLEQLIACSRALTEDVRQTASFIQGNSTLLFKRVASPQTNNNNSEWLEDYDYVNLESKEAVARKNAEFRDNLPADLRKGFDAMLRNAESAALNDAKQQAAATTDNGSGGGTAADPHDRQVVTFYATQATTHHVHLTHAIDAFLQTVEKNQPPKIFLAHGKFVVLSAHRLVHIGDTVHRNVTRDDVKKRSLNCANALSEALSASVVKTKQAALQFPSVTAVQEMVDSIVDISHLARDLKLCLVQAAQP